MKVYSWDSGQMIKIFAIPIYGKNTLIMFFLGLGRPNPLKLGMQHWELWAYQVYSDGDHLLTLTYLNMKSKQFISKSKY